MYSTLRDKIVPREALGERLNTLRAASPKPLVFTNGVFDILHAGHVLYLEEAAQLGTLLVAVNSDASTRRLGKGPDRPLNGERERMLLLAALASVSLVTLFDEDTPVALLHEARPQIYVKGGDYDMSQLEETRVVQRWGGQSLAIPFREGYSTTSLLTRVRSGHRP